MQKTAKISKVRNGYMVTLTSITGITATSTTEMYVFRSWNEVMILVAEFMGEYEGD